MAMVDDSVDTATQWRAPADDPAEVVADLHDQPTAEAPARTAAHSRNPASGPEFEFMRERGNRAVRRRRIAGTALTSLILAAGAASVWGWPIVLAATAALGGTGGIALLGKHNRQNAQGKNRYPGSRGSGRGAAPSRLGAMLRGGSGRRSPGLGLPGAGGARLFGRRTGSGGRRGPLAGMLTGGRKTSPSASRNLAGSVGIPGTRRATGARTAGTTAGKKTKTGPVVGRGLPGRKQGGSPRNRGVLGAVTGGSRAASRRLAGQGPQRPGRRQAAPAAARRGMFARNPRGSRAQGGTPGGSQPFRPSARLTKRVAVATARRQLAQRRRGVSPPPQASKRPGWKQRTARRRAMHRRRQVLGRHLFWMIMRRVMRTRMHARRHALAPLYRRMYPPPAAPAPTPAPAATVPARQPNTQMWPWDVDWDQLWAPQPTRSVARRNPRSRRRHTVQHILTTQQITARRAQALAERREQNARIPAGARPVLAAASTRSDPSGTSSRNGTPRIAVPDRPAWRTPRGDMPMSAKTKASTAAVLNLGGGTAAGGGEREATHPAIVAVMETISEQIANYQIPGQGESHEDNSILDVDSFLGSLGALREHLGMAFASVAETFGEGPVFHTVVEALRECGLADANMATELDDVHTEWQNNPENAHDLARGRGEIQGAELFNV